MTLWELREKYKNSKGMAKEFFSMSKAEARQVIESCGTPQGKAAMKRLWEKYSNNK